MNALALLAGNEGTSQSNFKQFFVVDIGRNEEEEWTTNKQTSSDS